MDLRFPAIMLAALGTIAMTPNTAISPSQRSVTRPSVVLPQQRAHALGRKGGLTCKHAPCVFPTSFASNPGPANEVPIAVNPNNSSQLLSAGIDRSCAQYNEIVASYASTDGGATWQTSCEPQNEGYDPVVAFDLNGTAYRGGGGCGLGTPIASSTNGGASWSAPTSAVTTLFPGGTCDKPWLQIDLTPTSPHANALYVSTGQQSNSTQPQTEVAVSHSYRGGAPGSWSAPVPVFSPASAYPINNNDSALAIGPTGTVYVIWGRCTEQMLSSGSMGCAGQPAQALFEKSTDGGVTWTGGDGTTNPTIIETVELAPGTCGQRFSCLPHTATHMLDDPSIAADPTRPGTLYVIAYSYLFVNQTQGYMRVIVMRSNDDGKTWLGPVPVTPSTDCSPTCNDDQFFPWISVSPDGAYVGAAFLDRRNDPQNDFLYQAYGAYSTNGGVSFQKNLQLTQAQSNPNLQYGSRRL